MRRWEYIERKTPSKNILEFLKHFSSRSQHKLFFWPPCILKVRYSCVLIVEWYKKYFFVLTTMKRYWTVNMMFNREKNKGIGVETYHYLNDGLWNMLSIKQWSTWRGLLDKFKFFILYSSPFSYRSSNFAIAKLSLLLALKSDSEELR